MTKRTRVDAVPLDAVPVKGAEYFFITPNGSLYSTFSTGTIKYRKKPNNKGYFSYAFRYDDGIFRQVLVHRLVAINFIPLMPRRKFVNHIDGIKSNNDVRNLEWVTHKQNMAHAVKMGLTRKKQNKTIDAAPQA